MSIGAACPDGCSFAVPECLACAEVAMAKVKGHMASKKLELVAQELVVCAASHDKDSRLLGNIRAEDLALLAVDYLMLIAERRR
jgi:hypothetical protein